jgi:hypothetical protein
MSALLIVVLWFGPVVVFAVLSRRLSAKERPKAAFCFRNILRTAIRVLPWVWALTPTLVMKHGLGAPAPASVYLVGVSFAALFGGLRLDAEDVHNLKLAAGFFRLLLGHSRALPFDVAVSGR